MQKARLMAGRYGLRAGWGWLSSECDLPPQRCPFRIEESALCLDRGEIARQAHQTAWTVMTAGPSLAPGCVVEDCPIATMEAEFACTAPSRSKL